MVSTNSQKEVWGKLNSIERRLSLAGGGGFAPSNAEYVVMSLNGSLTQERVLTAGIGLNLVDGGGTAILNVDVGIADDDIVQIDMVGVADNDYAKFTASGLEGRSYAEVLADLSAQALAAFDWNAQNLTNVGTIASGIIAAPTVKLSNLTDNYFPYHVSDAAGLADSSLLKKAAGIATLNSAGLNVCDNINNPVAGHIRLARSSTNEPGFVFENGDGANLLSQIRGINGGGIRFTSGTGATEWLRAVATNIGISQTSFGANATKTLAIGTGVSPTSSPANAFQMYSADIVAGNAAPHFRTEDDDVIKLYKYVDADFGNAINTGDADTDDAISAIISALTAHGLIAAA
jgi:hypothetical protein